MSYPPRALERMADVMAGRGAEPLEREWTTARAPLEEQFGLWQEAASEAFVPVTVTRVEPGPFVSGVTVRRLGAIEVADIASGAQSVHRSARQAQSSPRDVYFLNLPLSDGASLRQSGRSAELAAGDFALVDGDRPFDLHFGARFRQVSLTVPREVLDSRLSDPGAATGVRVRGDQGMGAVASAAIRAALPGALTLDRRSARELSEHLAGLIALSLGGLRPSPGLGGESFLLHAVLDEIERSFTDPELTPSSVAERMGISTRYLHRLFAEYGPTFGRWVLGLRLEHAHKQLVDPCQARRPVSSIALACGFVDPSYFSRAFKARYGLTPTRLRALALGLHPSALSS